MKKFTIDFEVPLTEMVREEVSKQVAYLAKNICNVAFERDGATLVFFAPDGSDSGLTDLARDLALQMQRSLRNVSRTIVYQSDAITREVLTHKNQWQGVSFFADGIVALSGLPKHLFNYFDSRFAEFSRTWPVQSILTPTLIPTRVLAKCDYFRSFPHNVTFATRLKEDPMRVEEFRRRHSAIDHVDDESLHDMATPEACLSPAVCYHVYYMHNNQTLAATDNVFEVSGKCFRYESTNLRDLRRLWDFTMREVVFMGSREYVLACRDLGLQLMSNLLDELDLAGEIRTASDPFFIAPDSIAKTYFQLSSETKLEVSLVDQGGERIAVGSLNYHSDFFGRAFNVDIQDCGKMHSVCIAFGIERWVHAFLSQHGEDPSQWPSKVQQAIKV